MSNITQLPLAVNYPWYSFVTSLGGTSYTLELYYNTRSDRWRMHVYDISGSELLLGGLPLVVARDLTSAYRHLQIPPGYLVVLDGDGTGPQAQPTLSSFMLNHALYYLELDA